jgi:hypothetical protein
MWRRLLLAAALLLAPTEARAFCGFYVSGADAKLFNNATQVVLVREGMRTVLSMQNSYQGPPEDFAMVVPVPVVLQKENVKTLPHDIFARIDRLTAPRLVEYWEQDPCAFRRHSDFSRSKSEAMAAPAAMAEGGTGSRPAVRVEAEFAVGEYEIVVLSADDSSALDTWLRQNRYKIPEGAEPVLRPYVQMGTKFFVARVNARKVTFDKGVATLSPLRFHYDDDRFNLPVRLGLLNSAGTQDLIINIIARNQRYEAANYPNAFIPTNLELADGAGANFGPFYAALFDRTTEKNPRAVITEYAWSTGSCDPCPAGQSLSPQDLTLLGGDVLPAAAGRPQGMTANPWEFTVSRLHARYTKESLGEDLVFRAAPAIQGGNTGPDTTDQGTRAPGWKGAQSSFQGRYIIKHPWQGEILCSDPQFGQWGDRGAQTATGGALVPRDAKLENFLVKDVTSLGLKALATPAVGNTKISWKSYVSGMNVTYLVGLAAGLGAVAALALRARRSS